MINGFSFWSFLNCLDFSGEIKPTTAKKLLVFGLTTKILMPARRFKTSTS